MTKSWQTIKMSWMSGEMYMPGWHAPIMTNNMYTCTNYVGRNWFYHKNLTLLMRTSLLIRNTFILHAKQKSLWLVYELQLRLDFYTNYRLTSACIAHLVIHGLLWFKHVRSKFPRKSNPICYQIIIDIKRFQKKIILKYFSHRVWC